MKSYRQIVEEAKTEIPEVTVTEVKAEQDKESDFVLLDVRDEDEYRAGYIPDAVHVTRGMLEFSVENYIPDRDQKVIVYCAAGLRSLLAAKSLREMRCADTVSLAGGYRDWAAAGLPTVQDKPMSHEQLDRYSRHFMLTEVGEQGQAKLLNAKVLMVGAGGLGSPAGVYLGAAGIGHLGIIDSDVVELSNLQRQILHRTESVGTPKVQSATTTIKSLNPDINITPYNLRLTADNVEEIFSEYDLIVDGCDNFATRYLVNDAAVLMNKPVVHGSIFQFEGQVTLFKPHEGPCYRCLFPTPPPPGMVPS
ncbi:MAG: ThiF family adenylyltransferase [Candidatus Poribacteria bacterium]|nr:ThiF family adenylyltransferase [Candidatus Poribacteria bacterium]